MQYGWQFVDGHRSEISWQQRTDVAGHVALCRWRNAGLYSFFSSRARFLCQP